jgi:hypothetical protein
MSLMMQVGIRALHASGQPAGAGSKRHVSSTDHVSGGRHGGGPTAGPLASEPGRQGAGGSVQRPACRCGKGAAACRPGCPQPALTL